MTLNVIFVCKTNDVLAVRTATADEQALDELKALPAENKLSAPFDAYLRLQKKPDTKIRLS